MIRQEDLTFLANQLAADARREAVWFLERASHYESIGRQISESSDPEIWARGYQQLVIAWSDADAATPAPGQPQ